MKAMVIARIGTIDESRPAFDAVELPDPEPRRGEIRIRVSVCGVCHTELDEVEGRTAPPRLPVVPGHQVVGIVDRLGDGVTRHALGDRVGVGWIHSSSGESDENLSDAFRATGRDVDGGYAEFVTVGEAYAHRIPDVFDDVHAAPLLCAGAVGYRALRLTEIRDGDPLGLMGFGGSNHIVLQFAKHRYPRSKVYVFARDAEARTFARELGADWAGDTDERPPEPPAAVIDTTPAWKPVVAALLTLRPGGRLVINAIRKQDEDRGELANLRYHDHLWMEKELKSVANVTGADIAGALELAAEASVRTEVETYPLAEAPRALADLKFRPVRGAKVLTVDPARSEPAH